MTNIKAISIPEPCHQSWQQMTLNQEGRHCAHCCKTVIDFTRMTNDEIIKRLSNSSNVCGRIDSQQLGGINYNLYAESQPTVSWWKRVAVIVGMLAPLAIKVGGQTKPNIIRTADTSRSQNRAGQNDFVKGKIMVVNSRVIKGVVTAKDDGLPIPGVTIKIKGTNVGTMTNAAGAFTLSIPANANILTVSFVGYTTQTITVNNDAVNPLHIVMVDSQSMIGEIVITKPIVKRPKNLWVRVKKGLGTYSVPAADTYNNNPEYY